VAAHPHLGGAAGALLRLRQQEFSLTPSTARTQGLAETDAAVNAAAALGLGAGAPLCTTWSTTPRRRRARRPCGPSSTPGASG
jgi:hypothetical protein